jgi:hypothetical protein
MECSCEEQTLELTIESDFMADPVWCSNCKYNLDLYDIPVSEELKEELDEWAVDFQKVLSFNEDGIENVDEEFNIEYTRRGIALTEKVKKELGDRFSITFKPYSKIYK